MSTSLSLLPEPLEPLEVLSSSSSSEALKVLSPLASLSSQCKDVIGIIAAFSKSCQYKIACSVNIRQSVEYLYGDTIQSCCPDPETSDILIALKMSKQILVYNCWGIFQRVMQINIPNYQMNYLLQIVTDGKRLVIRLSGNRLCILTSDGRRLIQELTGIENLGGISMYNGRLIACCNHSICTFDVDSGLMIGSIEVQKKFYYIYIDQENGDIYGYFGNVYVFNQRGILQRVLRDDVTSGGMMINAIREIIICNDNRQTGVEQLTVRKFDGSLARIVSFSVNNQSDFGGISFCDGKNGRLIICCGEVFHIIE